MHPSEKMFLIFVFGLLGNLDEPGEKIARFFPDPGAKEPGSKIFAGFASHTAL
jgi:hypothetical protein